MVAFARWRGAKYGNRATERREGKSKRKRRGIRLVKRRRKRWYFIERRGYYLVLRRYFTNERRARSRLAVICTAGERSHTKCFYIFYPSPLPLPDRRKPRNLSVPANLHARRFSGRASLANLAIDDPAFFEGRNEKNERKISNRHENSQNRFYVEVSDKKRQLRKKN